MEILGAEEGSGGLGSGKEGGEGEKEEREGGEAGAGRARDKFESTLGVGST